MLGVPEPADPENYCFEHGLTKTGSRAGQTNGWADVWLKGHFAWEYKRPGRSLSDALKQLVQYALSLDSPPLLVVCDRDVLQVHTHFTGTPSECHRFELADFTRPDVQERLRSLWTDPERWRPKLSNRLITEQAASTFAGLAERLRKAGVPAQTTSHFLMQCVFCFFAEDVGLLPGRLFEKLMLAAVPPATLRAQLQALLATMQRGGLFGVDAVPWFNGGLFETVEVPPLAEPDVAALRTASALDWSAIDPSILGTLFERGLDPAKRAQLGAHYTDPETILRLVEPVVQRPLLAEWAPVHAQAQSAMARSKRRNDKAWQEAANAVKGFLERLRNFRVLDPACGSGNFLYLALKCLKDVEHRVNLEADALGLDWQADMTGPHNVLGIELNEYAAELARVTVWIGELQWRVSHGYGFNTQPVLQPLDHIECRDAVLAFDPVRAEPVQAPWPRADAVVGNPPFVGDRKMIRELGETYTFALRAAYAERVPGGADLVCYWFERARAQIAAGLLQRAGLVATNSIRGGANRTVLDAIVQTTRIFEAWSDEPWINNGAAVRVSLIAFGNSEQQAQLDGKPQDCIHADLSAATAIQGVNLTSAACLEENRVSSFIGTQKNGPFDVPREQAVTWLGVPNVNGLSNARVVRPWANGIDVTRRPQDRWVVDFGVDMPLTEAVLFELPFQHVEVHVKPTRMEVRRAHHRTNWWIYGDARPGLRSALSCIPRFVVTPMVAKHRVFAWMPRIQIPENLCVAITRADDTTFGILHSRFHELWSLRMGTSLEDRPRYTPTTCFETFPFPAGLTPADTAHQRTQPLEDASATLTPLTPLVPAGLDAPTLARAAPIARAAAQLVALRDRWLNPPEWTERVPEVVPLGMTASPYPDRIVARAGFEKQLAERTLTKLYNQRPAWLAAAHAALNQAVAAAYGWPEDPATLSDDEVLRRLLALNRARAVGA